MSDIPLNLAVAEWLARHGVPDLETFRRLMRPTRREVPILYNLYTGRATPGVSWQERIATRMSQAGHGAADDLLAELSAHVMVWRVRLRQLKPPAPPLKKRRRRPRREPPEARAPASIPA